MLGPFSAESVTVNAKKLLEGFKNLLKTNQWLARYGNNDELDVTFYAAECRRRTDEEFRQVVRQRRD